MFGGSFDPVHMGHLIMAEAARETLNLDLVLFVPAAVQPLKQGLAVTSPEHRAAMIERAIENNPAFALSCLEVDRPGPSYTVDTLRLIRQSYLQADLWFILGADALLSFPRWLDPQGILAEARLAVIRRPGVLLDLSSISDRLPHIEDAVDWVEAPLIGISATDIRRRAASGLSLRYRVPEPVREYISANRLYSPDDRL